MWSKELAVKAKNRAKVKSSGVVLVATLIAAVCFWVNPASADNSVTAPAVATAGYGLDLALDSQDRPVISYFFDTLDDQGTKVMRCDDPACVGTEVSTEPDNWPYVYGNEIVLDSQENPLITYASDGNDIRLLHCDDPTCAGVETITRFEPDFSVQASSSVAVDSLDNPIVAIANSLGELYVVHCDDPVCDPAGDSTEIVDTENPASYLPLPTIKFGLPVLRLTSAGNPVIAYVNNGLKLLTCDDPSCSPGGDIITDLSNEVDTSDGVGIRTLDMQLDDMNNPAIVYTMPFGSDPALLRCSDPGCVGPKVTADLGDSMLSPSLAVDSNGYPVVAYGVDHQLMVLACGDKDCSGTATPTVAATTEFDVGGFPTGGRQDIVEVALTLGVADRPAIAYIGSSGLTVLRCDVTSCAPMQPEVTMSASIETVGEAPDLFEAIVVELTIDNSTNSVLVEQDFSMAVPAGLTSEFGAGFQCANARTALPDAAGEIAATARVAPGSTCTVEALFTGYTSATYEFVADELVSSFGSHPLVTTTIVVDGPPAMCAGLVPTIDMNSGASGIGTAGDDVILGTPGNDAIEGLGGNDTVCAGDGDDVVVGGDGDDTLLGEGGRDILRGNAGVDTVDGGPGNDRVLGGVDGDILHGGEGDDFIGGFGGGDTIDGGDGEDLIFGGFGADVIDGGAGADEIFGLIGNDTIDGGAGNDTLNGDRGGDTINGGDGNDTIKGGNGDDILDGQAGDDSVNGGRADDTLSGGPDTDTCVGNKENVADTADATCELIFGVP